MLTNYHFNELKHYLFSSDDWGDFIVGAESESEAYQIALDVCLSAAEATSYDFDDETDKLQLICELTDEEAEMSGLDEY